MRVRSQPSHSRCPVGVPEGEENREASFGFVIQPLSEVPDIVLEYNDVNISFGTGNNPSKAGRKKGVESLLQIRIRGEASSILQEFLGPTGEKIGMEIEADCTVKDLGVKTEEVCRLKVVDNSAPGPGNDTFFLEVVSGAHAGYSSSGDTLSGGNVQAHS